MSRRLVVGFAHRWTICAGCGDHRYCHARKAGGQRPVPVCNRCTRAYRRLMRDARDRGVVGTLLLLPRDAIKPA